MFINFSPIIFIAGEGIKDKQKLGIGVNQCYFGVDIAQITVVAGLFL